MEFLSLSRGRSTLRNVPSGEDQRGKALFADYVHSFGLIFEKKMGCQIKTKKSAVLVAKLLTWQIGMISQFCKNRLFFLIERIVWAHCILFNLLYHSLFRNVYRFFSFYTEFYKHIQFKKKKKNGESGYRSQFLPHAKRALYHLS